MKSYVFSCEMNIKPSNISYGDMEFDTFRAREVHINGQQNGEYHVASKSMDPTELCMILRARFPKALIGMIDPTRTLCLEFPIFMRVQDMMEQACMCESLEQLDDDLKRGGK